MVRDVEIHTSQTADDNADTSIAEFGPAEQFARRALIAQPSSLGILAPMSAEAVGARSGRLFIVDYGLRSIRSLDADGTASEELPLEGTIAGRAFVTGEPTTQGDRPTVMWWPLSEGSERIGLLELTFDDDTNMPNPGDVADVVRMMVLLLVSGRRYTDVLLRPAGCNRSPKLPKTVGPPPAAVLCRHEGRGQRHPRARLLDRW